jgi:hypothetical protein
LLEGRVRDPAVGREMLVGLFAGLAMATAVSLVSLGFQVVGTESSEALALPFQGLGSPLRTFCSLVHLSGDAVMFSGAVVFILVLLRALIPVASVANALWLALPVTIATLASGGAPDAPIVALTFSATLLLLLTRVGFLSVVAAQFVLLSTTAHPLTLRPGDWYFPGSLVLILTLAALGVASYRVAVAGRSAFEPEPPGAR